MNDNDGLTPDAKTALSEYKAALGPTTSRQAGALLAVQERIDSGNVDVDWDGPAGGPTGSGSPGLSKVWVLGGATVLVGGGLALYQVMRSSEVPGPAPAAVHASVTPPDDEPKSEHQPSIDEEAEDLELDTRQVPTTSTTEPTPPRKLAPVYPELETEERTQDPPPVTSGSTLREEMQLLSKGQAALNAGSLSAALVAFDEHRARFPAGKLASERELKRSLNAACTFLVSVSSNAWPPESARRSAKRIVRLPRFPNSKRRASARRRAAQTSASDGGHGLDCDFRGVIEARHWIQP